MKRKALGVFLALAATVPAIVAPPLAPSAEAQATTAERVEYPDVPRGHWAYEALNRLSQAGIIEGLPNGTYAGNKAMTRYEFAVAIARLLDRMPQGGVSQADFEALRNQVNNLPKPPAGFVLPDDVVRSGQIANFITRQEVNDLIAALRREFADELQRLGVRMDQVEGRISTLEQRVATPPRLTVTPSFLHRLGSGNWINNSNNGTQGLTPNTVAFGTALQGSPVFAGADPKFSIARFSYTDFELRLTDRVTDRLSVNAALRSIGDSSEDPWAVQGGIPELGIGGGTPFIREAFVTTDLSDRSVIGIRGLSAILGRQRTRVAQGLLYDNDLQPTDQLHAMFNLGPFAVSGFTGTSTNERSSGDPYTQGGAVRYVGTTGVGNNARLGFPAITAVNARGNEDHEMLVRAGINLFKIAGNPVQLGYSHLFDGVGGQEGNSIDLTLPLFNRQIGLEWVNQGRNFNAGDTGSDTGAFNVTVPIMRSRILDLNAAYGRADDGFEFFVSSAANPFARSYGEAIFDRPMALGAPLIARVPGTANNFFAAAKRVFDVNGTVRLPLPLLRNMPLDFRYYTAKGAGGLVGPGRLDLGDVYSVGTTFNLTPGLDLEVKYGVYNPVGFESLKYFRVGANAGF